MERRRDRGSDAEDDSDGEDRLRHEKDHAGLVGGRKVTVPDDEDYTGLAGGQGEKDKKRKQSSKRLSRKLRRIQVGSSRVETPTGVWGLSCSSRCWCEQEWGGLKMKGKWNGVNLFTAP